MAFRMRKCGHATFYVFDVERGEANVRVASLRRANYGSGRLLRPRRGMGSSPTVTPDGGSVALSVAL